MELPDLHLRRDLRAGGFRDDEVRRLVRAGQLTPVRRGSYVHGDAPTDEHAHHAVRIRAEVAHLAAGAVVSHVSAAVLHGLPTWAIPLDRVHVTRARRTGGRRGGQVHVHTAPLDLHEIQEVDGLLVTSVARTVVDLARTVPFEPAVAVADAALHAVRTDPDATLLLHIALAEALARTLRWRGRPNARRVLEFADARSDSVGESRSRVALQRAGLPQPTLQWQVAGHLVDFGWPALRTVGEFDGRMKYDKLLRPGQTPADAVYAEKLREDSIRAEGLAVVRWGWRDLADFTPVLHRLRSAFARP
ncbi:hypothetical protein BJF78_23880 [Pseudonocardia sp. CNS-139]|nr:hypothetical protein BJF78_23880 [Pseudonocardia sp. CNS-139]